MPASSAASPRVRSLAVLAEVALRGCLDAVVDAAVGDLVQVPLQDLVLGVAVRELDGVDGLLQLAGDGALRTAPSSGM